MTMNDKRMTKIYNTINVCVKLVNPPKSVWVKIDEHQYAIYTSNVIEYYLLSNFKHKVQQVIAIIAKKCNMKDSNEIVTNIQRMWTAVYKRICKFIYSNKLLDMFDASGYTYSIAVIDDVVNTIFDELTNKEK